jgi:lipid-A-disaccharide synthase
MGAADLLLVASGTATLEAACVGTPMVVVYRTSAVSYALGRLLVRVPHVALANLVAGRRAVPELIQGAATPARVAREAAAILGNPERGLQMRDAFREVRRRLGEPGAAGRAADIVLALARGEARA